MPDSKLPEQRSINTEGGNYNEHIEGNYIQGDYYAAAPPPPLTSIPQKIPHVGTPTFVGRVDELQEIAKFFENDSQLAITSAIKSVTGMGGVGKTELALQYALRYQELYKGGICWIEARAANNISGQITSFCIDTLGIIPPDYLKSQEKVDYFWSHWIEGQVLLIFDDVESYQNLKENLPPKNNKFKVIVTSRQRLGQLEQLKLKVLHPDKALELLKQIIGEERVEQELETARKLCEWLGYLPLGLELVARYLTTYDTLPLVKVLRRLEKKKLQARPLLDPDADEGDMTAQLGVGAAFELSWEKLSPKAQQLGCYLSLFKAELFNWAWVIDSHLFVNEDEEDEIEELEELRDGELRKFSLLDMSKENKAREPLFNFHPLISLYFASKLKELGKKEEFQAKFCKVMVKLARFIDNHPQPTKQQIEELSIIVPHLITVATEMTDSVEDEDINAPFFGIGHFYINSGLPVEATSWYERCWNIVKERFDENHFIYIESLENLACYGYGHQGKYPEALSLLKKVLVLKRKISVNEFEISKTLQNLAQNYRLNSSENFSDSEKFFIESLKIKKKILSKTSADSVRIIDESISKAYKSMKDGISLDETQIYGTLLKHEFRQEDTPLLKALAESYGDFAVLRILQAKESKDRQETTKVKNLLCEARAFEGLANSLGKKIRGENSNSLVPENPYYLKKLAEIALINEELEKAESLYNKIVEYCENGGGSYFSVYGPHIGLQRVYIKQGRFEDAERVTRQLLEFQKVAYGEEHRYIAITKGKLALICQNQNKIKEAESLLIEVINLQQKLVGEQHLDFAISLTNLAGLYRYKKPKKAKAFYQQALPIYERELGKEDFRTRKCRKFLNKCSSR